MKPTTALPCLGNYYLNFYAQKRTENRKFSVLFVVGGDGRDRTDDLHTASVALSRADGETPPNLMGFHIKPILQDLNCTQRF